MSKTVLITGTSSGIGKTTVEYFAEKGWNIAATVRNPEAEDYFKAFANVKVYKLDVTKDETIQPCIDQVIADFGGIDVLVNNAGFATIGAFEKSTAAEITTEFDTNVFGCMRMIKAVLPHFRSKHNGTIINITSIGGFMVFPFGSLYHSTKWAMEGFSEALWYELKPLGIRVKCIEPGPIRSDFYSRSMKVTEDRGLADYSPNEENYITFFKRGGNMGLQPINVAKTIYRAANTNNYRLRYSTDLLSKSILTLRRITPDIFFRFGLQIIGLLEKNK